MVMVRCPICNSPVNGEGEMDLSLNLQAHLSKVHELGGLCKLESAGMPPLAQSTSMPVREDDRSALPYEDAAVRQWHEERPEDERSVADRLVARYPQLAADRLDPPSDLSLAHRRVGTSNHKPATASRPAAAPTGGRANASSPGPRPGWADRASVLPVATSGAARFDACRPPC